jgi:hypothetical protein
MKSRGPYDVRSDWGAGAVLAALPRALSPETEPARACSGATKDVTAAAADSTN